MSETPIKCAIEGCEEELPQDIFTLCRDCATVEVNLWNNPGLVEQPVYPVIDMRKVRFQQLDS